MCVSAELVTHNLLDAFSQEIAFDKKAIDVVCLECMQWLIDYARYSVAGLQTFD